MLIIITAAALRSSMRITCRNLRPHAPRELFYLYGFLGLLPTLAYVHRPFHLLGVPHDEEVWHLLPGVLPDLLLHAHRRVVHLDPQTLRLEPLPDLAGVREVPVRHRYDNRLHRREPDRERAPVMLEAVSIEDLADDFQSAGELLLDLIFGAEYVRVILGERPHTGKACKLS